MRTDVRSQMADVRCQNAGLTETVSGKRIAPRVLNPKPKIQNPKSGRFLPAILPFALCILHFALHSSALAASPLEQAEYLFFNRHLASGNLDSAYRMLSRLHAQTPGDEHVTYLWSRIHLQKGDDARTKGDKLRWYQTARSIAETLQQKNPKNALGFVWWAAAHGRIGQTRGVLNSLFMVPDMKKKLNQGLELDPTQPTACDAYGVMYYELPGFAGGSLKKSEEYLLKGISRDRNYTVLRLDLAKVYIRQKRWAEARAQLDALLATASPTYPADFELDDKPEARELYRKLPAE